MKNFPKDFSPFLSASKEVPYFRTTVGAGGESLSRQEDKENVHLVFVVVVV